MKCDKCKKNEANFHSINNINGNVSEKHLCSECAKNEPDFNIDTTSFIDDFMSDFKTSFSYFTSQFMSLGFDEFMNDEFFGFGNSKYLDRNTDYQKQLKEQEKYRKELSEKQQKELEIKKLDIQLKKAVVEERYEDAIVLRDKIKQLKDNK